MRVEEILEPELQLLEFVLVVLHILLNLFHSDGSLLTLLLEHLQLLFGHIIELVLLDGTVLPTSPLIFLDTLLAILAQRDTERVLAIFIEIDDGIDRQDEVLLRY